MEPTWGRDRQTRVRRIATALATLTLPLALAACSGDDDNDVVSDPAPTSATAPTTEPTPEPTTSPTTGTYPPFEPSDYTYQLAVRCFCPDSGTPVDVTVEGGEVTGAVYVEDDERSGSMAGQPAGERYWLTINDIIDEANDSEAEQVTVDWPEGQDYPNQVMVDGHVDMADDEVAYGISNVRT